MANTLTLRGKHNYATVYTQNIGEETIAQIIHLLNQPFTEGSDIRIMPDCHKGKGSTIGTTMTVTDKIVPNLVGVDIGCGMLCVQLDVKRGDIDFEKLDQVIKERVPSGMSVRNHAHKFVSLVPLEDLLIDMKDPDRVKRSLGTLGGGNHFIELNEDEEGNVYLVIHSGSRGLGVQVASYYQKLAVRNMSAQKSDIGAIIKKLKSEGREKEIEQTIADVKSKEPAFDPALAYLEGKSMDDYIHDLKIAQRYAEINRRAMVNEILEAMNWYSIESFDTIHNYLDTKTMILRKGAISAQYGERVIIPMNMRDGSIIATGIGNPEWNYSGPHGAGRIMSRSKAKDVVNFDDYKESMKDVWTTSVVESTIDESPFAYKPMQEIIENIEEAVKIESVIKPLYNFKAK